MRKQTINKLGLRPHTRIHCERYVLRCPAIIIAGRDCALSAIVIAGDIGPHAVKHFVIAGDIEPRANVICVADK